MVQKSLVHMSLSSLTDFHPSSWTVACCPEHRCGHRLSQGFPGLSWPLGRTSGDGGFVSIPCVLGDAVAEGGYFMDRQDVGSSVRCSLCPSWVFLGFSGILNSTAVAGVLTSTKRTPVGPRLSSAFPDSSLCRLPPSLPEPSLFPPLTSSLPIFSIPSSSHYFLPVPSLCVALPGHLAELLCKHDSIE